MLVKLLSSTRRIGVLSCDSLSLLTKGIVRFETVVSFMFGRQSITKTQGSCSANKSETSGSITPLPENPRLIVGLLSLLPKMAGNANPGRDAQAPCIIEVP